MKNLTSFLVLQAHKMSSGHQGNQATSVAGTYQYQWGDQVVEIPSNINYQLENLIAAGGGVSIVLLLHLSIHL